MEINLANTDIISILNDLDKEKILYLCERAEEMRDLEKDGKRWLLNNTFTGENQKVLAYMFYEPSTRTRFRFDTAMRELGGKRDGFTGTEGTSMTKKETIRDTVKMMEANHFDAIVMRHPKAGALQWAADVADIPVINAGDGKNEHPTQALLDLFTIYINNNKSLDGLRIGLGGDLSHGRTIRSLVFALSHFDDVTIRWAAEDYLGLPEGIHEVAERRGVKIIRERSVEDVINDCEYYYMTRPQFEKMGGEISESEIAGLLKRYRITLEKIRKSKARLMHPLPVNGEVAEIEFPVFFTKNQLFYQQAENGIFLSKALLFEILSDETYRIFRDRLPESLLVGNNRLERAIKNREKESLAIDVIQNGVVLDHLSYGTLDRIRSELALNEYSVFGGEIINDEKKAILKIKEGELSERDYKKIAMISPEPTINIIRENKVKEKFVYLLCENENCITREIMEDVPPKFYNDDGVVRCRYCGQRYNIKSRKVSDEEKEIFVKSLPEKVEKLS
ncbi:MAG TPA: aspartate carbamoyltransferase [Candidatus Woesearchaeota archaeon]|nr:MAG: aspartate carbamoyltransferase [Candidatus Woesearchaeota archaeon]HDD70813.1 aspartate carbamoyltransferase [Candidatus Woesearchaeota archaeon]